ncbi:hypothetical protein GCM10027515_12730 [Schumannella luteola]|uniref:Uncharacterized protein n=1 Tax=Schumannella luteola TaxID=472059 RepID=A0A852Y925_9MICO|nr:hypothetical protein [Schumannella luteola]NYG97721.1 hypothetical protein [Schumannella luteola]TPX01412.1 hypothetical protein FJ656_27625 [Schumannella luteola]
MRPRAARRALPTAALVLALLAVGGAAWAFFTGAGTGSAAASSSTGSAVTLTTATVTTDLLPGGTTALALTAASDGGTARIPSLVLDGAAASAITVDAQHSAACPASWFAYTAQSTGWTVPAAPATLDITLPAALALAADAPSACQGATVTVKLKAGS